MPLPPSSVGEPQRHDDRGSSPPLEGEEKAEIEIMPQQGRRRRRPRGNWSRRGMGALHLGGGGGGGGGCCFYSHASGGGCFVIEVFGNANFHLLFPSSYIFPVGSSTFWSSCETAASHPLLPSPIILLRHHRCLWPPRPHGRGRRGRRRRLQKRGGDRTRMQVPLVTFPSKAKSVFKCHFISGVQIAGPAHKAQASPSSSSSSSSPSPLPSAGPERRDKERFRVFYGIFPLWTTVATSDERGAPYSMTLTT